MACILVVDDTNDVREVLREMLEREGYDVLDAPDGKEGLRIYQENDIDLVISDVLMPEKDGIEMVMQLKFNFPEAKVIVLTGGPEGFLKVAEKYDVKYTFKKPVDRKKLIEAVRDMLSS